MMALMVAKVSSSGGVLVVVNYHHYRFKRREGEIRVLMQANLWTTNDKSWKDKRSGHFGYWSYRKGCIKGLYHYHSEIIGFLITLLDDKFPFILSITCWKLSRFSRYIVQESGHAMEQHLHHGHLRAAFNKLLSYRVQKYKT